MTTEDPQARGSVPPAASAAHAHAPAGAPVTGAAPDAGSYVLALDSGTTSVRAILFDAQGTPVAQASRPITQIYPQPGWVEHDPREILAKQIATISEVQFASGIHSDRIAAVGITNQRETVVVWDRRTGEPVCNAPCWQCRRTEPLIARLRERGLADAIAAKTGLVLDPYFSASKLAWILENVPGARSRAERGELLFGTVDSWLVWNLTGGAGASAGAAAGAPGTRGGRRGGCGASGATHATDCTNASRTMLYNIHDLEWDEGLLELFGIPAAMLPRVLASTDDYGRVAPDIMPACPPITGVAGDQQASLFGHRCFSAGDVKATYGTGCFVLMNTGEAPARSSHGLVTTVAASPAGEPVSYALEGSVFNAGSVVQWLRDEMGLVRTAEQTEELALSVSDTAGVYVVPAFTGLGAPWWDANARGVVCGLTRGCSRAHFVRAALEGIAYQTLDVIEAMRLDFPDAGPLTRLAVDGGGSMNHFTMQWQADLLGCPVVRPATTEVTALGAAFLAGLGVGFWDGLAHLPASAGTTAARFEPAMGADERAAHLAGWYDALRRARS